MSGGTEEALREFIEAVNEDVGGLWIDHDEGDDTVLISLLGWANIQAIAEAYIVACNELGVPLKATLAGEMDLLDPVEAARLCELPRMK